MPKNTYNRKFWYRRKNKCKNQNNSQRFNSQSSQSIKEKIKTFSSTLEADKKDDALKYYLDKLYTVYSESSNNLLRRGGKIILITTFIYLINNNFITNGSISGLKVDVLKDLLFIPPAIIGFYVYEFYSFLASKTMTWIAIENVISNYQGTLKKLDLHNLTATPTFTDINRSISPWIQTNKFDSIVSLISHIPSLIIYGPGPLFAFLYVSDVAICNAHSLENNTFAIISIIFGSWYLLTGFILLFCYVPKAMGASSNQAKIMEITSLLRPK